MDIEGNNIGYNPLDRVGPMAESVLQLVTLQVLYVMTFGDFHEPYTFYAILFSNESWQWVYELFYNITNQERNM